MEMEELLTDAGFALVISGLLAATFTFQYVGNCGESSYAELHRDDCELYPPIFYGAVAVGVIGIIMVVAGVLRERRSGGPLGNDWTGDQATTQTNDSRSKK